MIEAPAFGGVVGPRPHGELRMAIVEPADVPAVGRNESLLTADVAVEVGVARGAARRRDRGKCRRGAVLDVAGRAGRGLGLIGLVVRDDVTRAAGGVADGAPARHGGVGGRREPRGIRVAGLAAPRKHRVRCRHATR